MRNIKLTLEYEGTNYYGWQIQPDLPTIQETIQERIKKITGEEVKLTAAGRTDTGVHALNQVCNFLTASSIPSLSLMKGLNSLLPEDIVVKDATDVDLSFHARKDAVAKTYKYLIINSNYPSSLYRNFSWLIYSILDIEAMREGAKLLIGEKDFSSFRASGCQSAHPIRSIDTFTIEKESDGKIKIEVKGRAFLRHMVRIIVGTIVDLGRGRITLTDFREIIEAKDRTRAGRTAPPQGLFLKSVEY